MVRFPAFPVGDFCSMLPPITKLRALREILPAVEAVLFESIFAAIPPVEILPFRALIEMLPAFPLSLALENPPNLLSKEPFLELIDISPPLTFGAYEYEPTPPLLVVILPSACKVILPPLVPNVPPLASIAPLEVISVIFSSEPI